MLDDVDIGVEHRAQHDVACSVASCCLDHCEAALFFPYDTAGTDVIHGIAAVERLAIGLDIRKVSDDNLFRAERLQLSFLAGRYARRAYAVACGGQLRDQQLTLMACRGGDENPHVSHVKPCPIILQHAIRFQA